MNTLETYRTTNLFLLLGRNPLPNLVAAELLLPDGGNLYLIHSHHTTQVAERLKKHRLLAKRDIHIITLPQVHESNAANVREKLEPHLKDIQGTVGLHYAGGTKVMAVHTYRLMEELVQKPVFSYLNADTFELWLDTGECKKVLLKVKPTLRDLTELHGIFLQSGLPSQTIMLPKLAAALAKAFSQHSQKWRAWANGELRKRAYDKRRQDWKAPRTLTGITLPFPPQAIFGEVKDLLVM